MTGRAVHARAGRVGRTRSRGPGGPPPFTLGRYLRESRGFANAVLFTMPLFLLYEGGLLLATQGEVRNAADVWIRSALDRLGRSGGLVLNAGVLVAFLAAVLYRDRRVRALPLLPLVALEGTLFALLIVPVVAWIRQLALLRAPGPPAGPFATELVLGLGAGLYEELLFRLVLVAGGYALLRRLLHFDPVWAAVLPLLLSSLAFSAFHHLGRFGEPWDVEVFTFRFLAGMVLGTLFLFRGFAVACWTHAVYDTLWLLPGLGD